MKRTYNTTVKGYDFTDKIVEEVWKKAEPIYGRNEKVIRMDTCGAVIFYCSYGCPSDYGWEIDHIKPVSLGGTDELSNLQPLNWQNNRHKDNDFPEWECYRK